ncbi:MAG: Hsp70 family protein [Planctomycetaceae bacterium]
MSHIVGIDLGTTNSLVAVFQNGQPRLIPNAHGKVLTPSIVGVLGSGEVVVGDTARELRVTEPTRCVWAFKRWMGQSRQVSLADRVMTPPELSSLILRSLKQDAELFLGGSVSEAVITVPAYFNEHQRKATRLAGELAGLKVRRIINEPTAAALAYGFHERDAEKRLLVFDLGGGTFDVTLMDVSSGIMEIVATAGENFLGGEDFTERIVADLLSRQGLQLEVEEHRHPRRVSRLRSECEAAKRALLETETASIRLPDAEGQFPTGGEVITLSREDFTRIAQPLLKRLQGPLDRVLRDAQMGPAQVDDVILVGGASRLRDVAGLMTGMFGRPPRGGLNPDEVVALGAAIQSALMRDEAEVQDLVMTDVCPHSLGVQVAKVIGGRQEEGYFSPIIHRNTTIPVSREEIYCTLSMNQTSIKLQIFQGESRHCRDNLQLGTLEVSGIPPGPPGQTIIVRFTYDLNGLLEVESLVPGTDKRFQVVLNQDAAGLSPAEVREAVERMRQVKFYPRDQLENQRLLQYCERLVGEVAPQDRATLEEALDVFEQGLSSGNREVFAASRSTLLQVLALLGFEAPEFEGDANAS